MFSTPEDEEQCNIAISIFEAVYFKLLEENATKEDVLQIMKNAGLKREGWLYVFLSINGPYGFDELYKKPNAMEIIKSLWEEKW